MKKKILHMLVGVLLLVVWMPMRSLAEGGAEVRLDDTGMVIIVSQAAAEEGVCSLQLSLKVDSEKADRVEFEFAECSAKILEFRYHGDEKKLNIYLAGTEALFPQDSDALTIGRVAVLDAEGRKTAARVSVVEDSVQYVHGTELKTMENLTIPEPVVINAGSGENQPPSDSQEGEDSPNPGGDVQEPEGDHKGDGAGDAQKPDDSTQDAPGSEEETQKPGDNAPSTGEETQKPEENTQNGSGSEEETQKPEDNAPSTGEETQKPEENTQNGSGSEEETQKPGDNAPSTGEGTQKPGNNAPSTGEGTQKPGNNAPSTGEGTQKPGDSSPSTGEGTQKPGDHSQGSGTGTETTPSSTGNSGSTAPEPTAVPAAQLGGSSSQGEEQTEASNGVNWILILACIAVVLVGGIALTVVLRGKQLKSDSQEEN